MDGSIQTPGNTSPVKCLIAADIPGQVLLGWGSAYYDSTLICICWCVPHSVDHNIEEYMDRFIWQYLLSSPKKRVVIMGMASR